MEAHASHHIQANAAGGTRSQVDGARIAKIGAIAGLTAGMMMAMWQMVVGAIAQEPTAVPGIDSSFWTAITSIPSVLFGTQWFHGSFEFWAVALGLMGHMMNSMALGIMGVAISIRLLGPRPNIASAMAVGMMFGLVLEVVVVNLIVNQIQDVNTLYTSTPEWSWWVAHGIFGATLGMVAATLLRRRST
ncbi:MAG: hypothetical protein FVQ78_07860 [Solirubrobacterales bacterium]|nr:hypothetical protein [Solirubrobacterales bacterium]